MGDTKARIVSIDAARGTAMLFSCLAHFGWWLEPKYPTVENVLSSIGMVATPMFLLLSGATTGVLCASAQGRTLAHKYRLLNRGLFLLTFGHLLIALAESHRDGGLINTIVGASIVDEIGIAMLLAGIFHNFLADDINRRRVGAMGIVAFMLLWIFAILWHPEPQNMRTIRQALIGPDPFGHNLVTYTTPTLQYLAVFAMGLPLGGWFGTLRGDSSDQTRVTRLLFQLGTCLVLGACVARIMRLFIHRIPTLSSIPMGIDVTMKVASKTPPSPAYLAFYAGVALLLTGSLIHISATGRPPFQRLVGNLAVIGRASLFVFVLQYFLYWTLPDALGIEPSPYSWLLFGANILILWIAAKWWGSVNGNRLLTVGLRPAPIRVSRPRS